jgi:hypothetical protein
MQAEKAKNNSLKDKQTAKDLSKAGNHPGKRQ